MDSKIIDFLKGQKIASICCIDSEGKPYCFTCFYVFDINNHSLLFKSSKESLHIKLLHQNAAIAGTVVEDNIKLSSLKGIQFKGQFQVLQNTASHSIKYHKKFPFALAFKGDVCAVKLLSVKMTDNNIGFSRKLSWEDNVQLPESAGVHDQNHV